MVPGPNWELEALLREEGLDPGWEIRQEGPGPWLRAEFWSQDGLPLCGFYAQYHRFKDGSFYLVGELPPLPPPSYPRFKEFFTGAPPRDLLPGKTFISQKSCLFYSEKSIRLAWEVFYLTEDGLLYQAFIGKNRVYSVTPHFFEGTASLTGYNENPKDGAMASENLELKDNKTTLDSSFFTTDPSPTPRINESNLIFAPDQEDPLFPEVNIFMHASRMIQWFEGLGYVWSGSPITLVLHKPVNSSVNNALYVPNPQDTLGPKIMVGDGDGQVLQNLALDGDVVSHELGHHIVYRRLKSTSQIDAPGTSPPFINHSLAIHEGLADFFTFARTDNSCLGESICPAGSAICYEPESCLRTADNSILYGSPEYEAFGKYGHLKGQVVSGLLWDLRKKSDIPEKDLDQIVFNSVGFLPEKAVYLDLIKALLAGDKDTYQGAYFCKIIDKVQKRGFTEELKAIDQTPCGGPGPVTPVIEETPTTEKTPKKQTSGGACGVMPPGHGGGGPPRFHPILWLILGLLLPFIYRRPQRLTKKP
jgi:hypothetical protein